MAFRARCPYQHALILNEPGRVHVVRSRWCCSTSLVSLRFWPLSLADSYRRNKPPSIVPWPDESCQVRYPVLLPRTEVNIWPCSYFYRFSFQLHANYRVLHEYTRNQKRKRARGEGPDFDGELNNFQAPELSSLVKLVSSIFDLDILPALSLFCDQNMDDVLQLWRSLIELNKLIVCIIYQNILHANTVQAHRSFIHCLSYPYLPNWYNYYTVATLNILFSSMH